MWSLFVAAVEIKHLEEYKKFHPKDTFFVNDKYVFKEKHGVKWKKIFYHHSEDGILYENDSEALFTNQIYKYSILKEFEWFPSVYPKGFEFLLEYPELGYGLSNRWIQTNNPINTFFVTGYVDLSISWSDLFWAGLIRYNSKTCIDMYRGSKNCTFIKGDNYGTYDIANWNYAIGAYYNYPGGSKTFPGPDINSYYVNLWIRANSSDLETRKYSLNKKHCRKVFTLSPLLMFFSFLRP